MWGFFVNLRNGMLAETTAVENKQEWAFIKKVEKAELALKEVIDQTPLQKNLNLSETYDCNVFLKREDLQVVRSYKIRGAYNKIHNAMPEQLKSGVVCASAGNHAQGVAYSCRLSKIKGTIFMPVTTPNQKVKQVQMFGREYIEIKLTGDSFDDAFEAAQHYCKEKSALFIHPFDDPQVIAGQGTVGMEILQQAAAPIDYLFVPIGGGGLISGVGSLFKTLSPNTKIIGVEPSGAAAMQQAVNAGKVVSLQEMDTFVDGAAVRRVGALTYTITKQVVDKLVTVDEGAVCAHILSLYNEQAIVVEPAGALAVTALEQFKEQIKGKNVVVLLSGSNNDITRTGEIRERALLYKGLKHYFIIRFPQRAGALRQFVNNVLAEDHDITHFEYSQKTNREKGPAVVGIEIRAEKDLKPLLNRMKENGFIYEYLNDKPDLFQYMVL